MEEKRLLLKFTLSNYPNLINEDNISFDDLDENQIDSVDIQDLMTIMKQNQKIYFNFLFNIQKNNGTKDTNPNTPNSASNLSWPSPSSNPMVKSTTTKKTLPTIPMKKELPKIPTKPLPTPTPIVKIEEEDKPIPSRIAPKSKLTDVNEKRKFFFF